MKNSRSESYAAAGVDITAGYRAVELMKAHIARTMTSGVCSDVGGFGGLFELDVKGMEKPELDDGLDYSVDKDAFTTRYDPDAIETFTGTDIDGMHLYPIGYGSWTWTIVEGVARYNSDDARLDGVSPVL